MEQFFVEHKKKNIKAEEKVESLNEQIVETIAGLMYMSESEAPVLLFKGTKTDFVSIEVVSQQIGKKNEVKVEEKGFDEFFAPLIKIKKWYGEEERKQTEKFIKLKEILQINLIDKKVFRIGKKDIEIYVVGLDKNNILCGIKTRSVET